MFSSNPVFICNILKGDLYILIQTLGEGTLVQMSLLVCEGEEVGELVQPGGK